MSNTSAESPAHQSSARSIPSCDREDWTEEFHNVRSLSREERRAGLRREGMTDEAAGRPTRKNDPANPIQPQPEAPSYICEAHRLQRIDPAEEEKRAREEATWKEEV